MVDRGLISEFEAEPEQPGSTNVSANPLQPTGDVALQSG
jgi:hypothetical protein